MQSFFYNWGCSKENLRNDKARNKVRCGNIYFQIFIFVSHFTKNFHNELLYLIMMNFFVASLKLELSKYDSKIMEFIRFVVVGLIATTVHYCIYILLLPIFSTTIAYSCGYGLSFCVNFLLSTYFTFKSKLNLKKGIGFGVSHLINYSLHIFLLNIFLSLGITKQYAPFLVFIIVIPVNFLLVRTVFKNKKLV